LNDNELCKQLLSQVKFRVFATFQYDKRQILSTILREFDYLYEHESLNVQK
ncbi:MAG: competence protein, partial [Staphylococcus epidermidis]|nr:competence protein [Staphylococcus epidermidis]